MINIIGAMDRNRNIGLNGDMPWGTEMKSDLQRFKELTQGQIIVMGRKTFESLPGILPDRLHYVLTTQDLVVRSPMVNMKRSVQEVLDVHDRTGHDMFIIGGAQIYEQFMPYADNIYLTKILANLEGDTKFPPIVGNWDIVQSELTRRDGDKYSSQYVTYTRRRD